MIKKSAVEVLSDLDQETGKIARFYFLSGSSGDYLKEQILEKIEKVFLKEDEKNYSKEVFYGDNFSFRNFEEAINSPSFFGKKLIIIKNAEEIRDEDLGKIVGINIPDYSILIIVTTSKKIPLIATQEAVIVEDYSVNTEMKNAWIRKKFKEQGKDVSQEAINELVERLDDDFELMDKEITKICLYAGDKKKIDKREIEDVVEYYSEVDIYGFIDLVLENKHIDLMNAYESFIKGGSGVKESILLNQLLRSILDVLLIKELLEKGIKNKREINNIHKLIFDYYLPNKDIDRLERLGSRYSKNEILNLYEDLLEIDYKNKIGEVDLPLGLKSYLQKLKIR